MPGRLLSDEQPVPLPMPSPVLWRGGGQTVLGVPGPVRGVQQPRQLHHLPQRPHLLLQHPKGHCPVRVVVPDIFLRRASKWVPDGVSGLPGPMPHLLQLTGLRALHR